MTAQPISPGDVWIVDLDPVHDEEQAGQCPVLVVSSRFHLELTNSALVNALPLTGEERSERSQRVHVAAADSWVATERVHTVAARNLRRFAPELAPTEEELSEVRRALARTLDI
ncbi:mRNA interferase MazF [Actinopolyspora lacussalsi]|uniref:mRNA interferase MazF n=1 Tax=Actinopolyspora righensis TaxID=995060 RepID=A0A1I6YRT1_9ACTN|nr:type II toxin-antitoxin system PemK/MazF family toxin [Actinopolyspora righensis]MDP9640061.1 mRNA interferase MazF [Actinopolyspora lacussalsi]SFT53157.1 mRNA interferase MazF [Actinopolyspora righensis]